MIYFLDGNQEVIKIVRSSAVISAIQTQELPEDNSLLRDYLSVRLKNDERLFNAQYMAIKTHGGNRNAFDLYRIAGELVPDNATEFMGVQVAPYELEGVVIEDLRPINRPLNQTMDQALEDSDWRLGYVADNLPNVTTNFYYTSVKDALKKIQESTNVEMLFKVEISGNKVTDKWVEVYHQLGNRTMKRFNYGTNTLSVVRESSHDELYTALIGRGKGEEVGETESGDATYGRKINFADVEWKKSAGNPVDKPKGQKYIELPNATAEYGIKLIDGRKVPRIGIVDFSETDDPEKLIQETYQELLVRARPKVLFKASVINTGDMLIGDTVTIHRHDLDFHYQARVRKVVRDRKNNNKTQVEIGDVVHTASTKRQGQINSALNNVTSDLENMRGEVTEARQSADGKNTNFYGNVEPDRKKVGDTWFRDHPSLTGESQILVWNGEAWELTIDTSETTKNADAIAEQQQDIEEAKQTADEAVEQINTAVANAGFTSLDETISSVQTISNQAQINSGTAISNAFEAMQQASQAIDNTGSLNIRVDEVENTLSLTADKQTVADLTGVVDSQALDIQANAQGLAMKAEQSTVDTLAGTVSSLGTNFDIVAGQVNSRVWSTDIETAVDGIEIGGRNLLLNSNFATGSLAKWGNNGSVTFANIDGKNTAYMNTSAGIYQSNIVKTSGVHTFSFMAKALDNNTTAMVGFLNITRASKVFSLTSAWRRYEFTTSVSISTGEFFHIYSNGKRYYITDIQLEKGNKATDWSPAPEDTDAKIDYIETEWTQTFDSFSQTVAGIDGRVSSQEQTVSGMQSVVYDPETGLSSLNTQLANLVQVAVTGGELSNALSVTETSILAQTVKNGEVVARINQEAGVTLIQNDKLYLDAETVAFSGQAFIPSAAIQELSADKVTTGTLNAAHVAITNLNASSISTGTLDGIAITGVTITGSTFIQESSLAGSTFGRWDRTGITLRDSAGTMIMDMNREGINFHGTSTETSGTYINNNLIDVQKANIYDLNVTGTNARLRGASFAGNIHVGNISTGTGHGVRFTGQTVPAPLDRMLWVGYGYDGNGIYQYFGGWRKLALSSNTSDARLKNVIGTSVLNSFETIMTWEFVDFEWKDTQYYSEGTQFGLIAQNTKEIGVYHKSVDRWEIDTQKQTMMNSHAIQQVGLRELNTNKIASQALQATETNAQKIERLEKRIEELESAA